MFLLGFFWPRTTGAAAMFAAIASVALSVVLKFLPDFADLSFLAPIGFAADNGSGVYEIPFLDRTLIVFLLIVIGMAIISLLGRQPDSHIVKVDRSLFKVEPGFAFGSAVVCVILAIIYAAWW
jgi:SSS family solute:Na+ symporter